MSKSDLLKDSMKGGLDGGNHIHDLGHAAHGEELCLYRDNQVVCGGKGGEPSSVKFCHKVGLNYVSCSPFRVPIARLAAAQAAIEE